MDGHVLRAARAYSAAADHYCLPALGFWDRLGAETVVRLSLVPGSEVLDLCCGAGASALAAARAVGPAGKVIAVDVAAPLLELARERAARESLTNVEFRLGDATSTGLPDRSFDAVVCVFAVFFAADMAAFTAEMWRLVRDGGKLAITTWGPGWGEPLTSVFWEAVRDLDPELHKAFNPWDEITSPEALAGLFERAGVTAAVTEVLADEQPIAHPNEAWDVVLGSGLRGTVDALAEERREALRERVLATLRARGVTGIKTDVVLGRASRGPPRAPAATLRS